MLANNIHEGNLVLFGALGPIADDAFVAITTSRLCSCSSAMVPFTCRPVRSVRHAYQLHVRQKIFSREIRLRLLSLHSTGAIAADYRHAFVAIVTSRLRSSAAVRSTSDAVRCMRHAYPRTASLRGKAATDEGFRSSASVVHPAATFMCDAPCALGLMGRGTQRLAIALAEQMTLPQ